MLFGTCYTKVQDLHEKEINLSFRKVWSFTYDHAKLRLIFKQLRFSSHARGEFRSESRVLGVSCDLS